jgi:hypothetical protein
MRLSPQEEMHTVKATKNLRAHAFISEAKTCFKCPHKVSCPVAGKEVALPLPNTAVEDMMLFTASVINAPEDIQYRVLTSAWKIADSFTIVLDDLKAGADDYKKFEEERKVQVAAT